MSWRLVTSDGQSFRIHRSAIAGRSSSVHIVLHDPLASRQHAEFRAEGNTLMVRDLGSQNGTYVNRVRITAPCTLRPGDRLMIGNTTFQVQWIDDQVVVPRAPVPAPMPASPPAVSHQPIKYTYCSNCMSRIAENAEVCPQCGAPQGVAAAPRQLARVTYCPSCGAQIAEGAAICPKCGMGLARKQPVEARPATGDKEWLITLLLCVFLGYLGAHRFYTGHIAIGLIQLFTGGLCGIWSFIDLILILTGSYRDAEGYKLVK
ncbi:MAG TPA: FHA domain-containing protein [Anaerolineae bacterium]|nr:FHA domain-containing protein [Anaerolineae bacterium]